MTDINDWIKERRTIHDAADCLPWTFTDSYDVRDSEGYRVTGDGEFVLDTNAEATVDAVNTLPTVLTALEKVLELHRPVRGASRRSPDVCAECDALIGEPGYDCGGTVEYPCPTVRAIEGAIND